MDELLLLNWISWAMIGSSLLIFLILQFIPAFYGRYRNESSALHIGVDARIGWVIQEIPSFLIPVYYVVWGEGRQIGNIVNQVILCMFIIHYTQRTFIFSALMRGGKPYPVVILAAGVLVCTCNGYIQGLYHTQYAVYSYHDYNRVIVGVITFTIGLAINIHSDYILRNLRRPGETGYKIPTGGMFEYVSGANFLGEVIEWCGYAIAAASLPAISFVCLTVCTLIPRACSHHKWYLETFRKDYPQNRKAVIPYIL